MADLLEVADLRKNFPKRREGFSLRAPEEIAAVAGVNLSIGKGEIVGLVGESGSGKTTVGRCIARLERPTSGTICFEGVDVTRLPERDARRYRRAIQMIFQDSHGSLNPRRTAAETVAQPLKLLANKSRADRDREVKSLFDEVGLPASIAHKYRHQMSGGQQQRVNIARALAVRPSLLILDEPVSGLDASIRARVTRLLKHLHELHGLSYLLISHDLHHVRDICSRVAIMYRGRIVEYGSVEAVFSRPVHPHTQNLLRSILLADPGNRIDRDHRLETNPTGRQPGAADVATAKFLEVETRFVEIEAGHFALLSSEGVE